MSGHSHGHSKGGALRQASIVGVLILVLVALHMFAGEQSEGLDPTGMLALGFVVLASYTIGALVDVIKLPHITGYLLAGVIFGHSIAHLFFHGAPAPFHDGVLNESVIKQLSLLNTLAIGLIALTAGGELRIENLKHGLGAIIGVLTGQFITIMVLVTGFIWLISGVVDVFTLPGIGAIPSAVIPLGLTVAAISFATSPAATIAVINDSGADGPMARTVMSSVVLKDVLVVVAFAIFSMLAGTELGVAAIEGGLAKYLATHILGSIALGAVLGFLIALYLQYVRKELLLFIVGMVYTASYLATSFGLDSVLLFLAAGFVVTNFSKTGHTFIETVEQLSLPVYVVFFTLAGATLHIDTLMKVGPFAIALVLVRVIAIWIGCRFGAVVGRADDATRKYGWMGFVSQAGVAITLASQVGEKFGEPGEVLSGLLIGGVALNELIGPVMLKLGLERGGEVHQEGEHGPVDEGATDEELSEREQRLSELPAWPETVEGQENLWGDPLLSESRAVDRKIRELELDLKSILQRSASGALTDFREHAEGYVRDLRREFLRHHRRLVVKARSEQSGAEFAQQIHLEQAEVAERWRAHVLSRGARLGKWAWSPDEIIESLDAIADTLPERIKAPVEPDSFVGKADDGLWRSVSRWFLRVRRGTRRLFGGGAIQRNVDLQSLGRFHLSGETPARLESIAALLVHAEQHLISRTRSIFDGMLRGYDALAAEFAQFTEESGEEAEGSERSEQILLRLSELRAQVEEELALAVDEVARIEADGTRRSARVLAFGLNSLKKDVLVYDTLDLPAGDRRASRVFKDRVRGIDRLTEHLGELRQNSKAGYAQLAMELEVFGLQSTIKDALEEHVSRLEREVQGRAADQVQRVQATLEEAMTLVVAQIESAKSAAELSASIRQLTEGTEKVAGEASRISYELRDELMDEGKVAPLLDSLARAAGGLTSRYNVVAGRMARGEMTLPAPGEQVEVPFREVVTEFIETRVAPHLIRPAREMASRVQPLAAAMQELERLIAFNVELASGELDLLTTDEVPDDTRRLLREMVSGQLERSEAVLAEFAADSKSWPNELGVGMREAVLGSFDHLRGELIDGEISRARLDELRRSASRQRLLLRARSLPDAIAEISEQLKDGLAAVVGEARVEMWRKALGLPAPSRAAKLSPELFAMPQAGVDLPLVYRRLFAADTMEAVDVLTGREEAINVARRLLSRESGGNRLRTTVLVGIDGVGKSAVASAVVRGARSKSVKRVSFTEPVTLKDLDQLFAETSDGQLVVIDGLYWMMSAQPGGFEVIRSFVARVLEDRGSRAWLIQADKLFWTYASSVAPLAEAFTEVVELEPLTPTELQAAVMARHRLSGYGHSFDRFGSDTGIEGLIARGASKFRRPFDQYFQDLHAATGGLVRDALRLWLASIRSIESDDLVHVGQVPRSGYTVISRLPEESLIRIFQISRQGWMTVSTFAYLFRVNEAQAHAELARLTHYGLLVETAPQTYQIATHLRGAAVRVFDERNWV